MIRQVLPGERGSLLIIVDHRVSSAPGIQCELSETTALSCLVEASGGSIRGFVSIFACGVLRHNAQSAISVPMSSALLVAASLFSARSIQSSAAPILACCPLVILFIVILRELLLARRHRTDRLNLPSRTLFATCLQPLRAALMRAVTSLAADADSRKCCFNDLTCLFQQR